VRNELTPLGPDGRALQTVRFGVRGAVLKGAAASFRSGG
jgi:hypothetical protein